MRDVEGGFIYVVDLIRFGCVTLTRYCESSHAYALLVIIVVERLKG